MYKFFFRSGKKKEKSCNSMNYRISLFYYSCFAEAGGFEPPVQFPVRQFSKLVVSATHPHFQVLCQPQFFRIAMQI